MSSERYVLLGLAPPRSSWFAAVAGWATSATIAAEFVKCVSAEEVRARLASGRPYSALLVDARASGFDRDLVAAATATATPVVAVAEPDALPWSPEDLRVAAVLPPNFGRLELLEVLASHSHPIGRADRLFPAVSGEPSPWRGRLLAVCGAGGTGASTVAIAIAQAHGSDPRYGHSVLLADLARRADQAMLHDTGELGPALQELVEAHRTARPSPEEVRRSTFEVDRRGYRLLLGLRRPEAWAALRPRSIDAAIDGLRRSFQVVVADVTGDFEGEAEGGSIDVEERNHLARAAVLQADLTIVVGTPGLKGLHSLALLVRTLAAVRVEPTRILPVFNRAPRSPLARSELSRALATLVGASSSSGALAVATPVFVPERKLEEALRDGLPLPRQVVEPLASAVKGVLSRLADAPPAATTPERVVPGSLGSWPDAGVEA